ncbi:putative serine/threonine protein phosphatase 2B catalytic subunit A2 [Trypanosoma vivax]|uniref:Serine/threonine-protein phosphatase n=1 Tax=Trypanosoma vivax (strain Y486) TaxID=1055687 RepID=G0U6T9_TRYVY|nr:putative serine/threonine protein phosphatase 2B catalytic subunit A2 [Trypanosoma vivax]CCC51594.1 putative serine/threonine protein phosphatase 2B catalytic subunit A2 [Trypanosoma vivax Y486]
MLSSSSKLNDSETINIPPPLWSEAKRDTFIDRKGKINMDTLLVHFLRQGRLKKHDALSIIQRASSVLHKEPNVLRLDAASLIVVGDIRGQFYDLAKIIRIGGMFSSGKTYLFLGNYADSNYFSCECILFLLAAKITHPSTVFLLRGNHESRFMTKFFDFEGDCLQKYNDEVYLAVMEAYDCLPLAAVVNKQFFCVHGGLSPDVSCVDHIGSIYRFREPPSKGAMCDLLWSDPLWDVENPSSVCEYQGNGYYNPGNGPLYGTSPCFLHNEQRGCSYLFNYPSVKHFLLENELLCIIRSHEVQDDGFKLYRFNGASNFPCMISVFSAPNYCDSFDNKGAILHLEGKQLGVKQFFSSPHPYVLPKRLNAFQWSIPFLLSSIHEIFSLLLSCEGS